MKVHTDTLTAGDLHSALADAGLRDVYIDARGCGSRSRDHAFDFRLEALRGSGRRRNSGTYGAERAYAATYDEHGTWMARLFDRDPTAIVGPYRGRDDFHAQTANKYADRAVSS